MVSIGVICLNATDWKRAAQFWAAALGYTPHPRAADILVPPGGDGPSLALYQRDRTHLDLHTADRAEQQAEVERLLSLGAQRVPDWPYPDGADFLVLRDTEGNLFCVLDHE
ncbi:VOC family protein [Actinopolymorpha sp. B11F2]|uniref:VOC family protein n=1 Tax=Actinopolymorpha sp. B11F2 TaxID=3160862 RepID=UPI0032E38497